MDRSKLTRKGLNLLKSMRHFLPFRPCYKFSSFKISKVNFNPGSANNLLGDPEQITLPLFFQPSCKAGLILSHSQWCKINDCHAEF